MSATVLGVEPSSPAGVTPTDAPERPMAARAARGLALAREPHLLAAALPALLAFVVYVVFSVTRHLRFGSGSWDMGCYVHNLYLLGFGKPPVSSVLGDAHFWGGTNHFMPSLYLAAPLAWTGSTSILLVLQAALVAAATLPLALLARRRGLGPAAIAGLSLAYLFAVGTQTMINFDVHEIAPVPLCMFLALWGFESGRRGVAWASLLVMAGTKESAIVYAAAVGLFVGATVRGRRLEGLFAFALFLSWFFIVTTVIQPAFLEEGARGMIHVARFQALGEGPLDIAKNAALHPLRTLSMLVTPETKAQTLAITAGGFALLPLLAPEALLLAGPNLAERFLSDKREMWGLGFHYSLVLVGICAFASVLALARLKRLLARLLPSTSARAFDVGAGLVLVAATILSHRSAPFPPEFATLHKPYMASAAEAGRYRRALALVPDDARVVAQNHFLPHLAYRQHIWQPHRRFVERAEWVVLDARASPWPHNAAHVRQLIDDLRADPRFVPAFEEATTVVFRRWTPADAPPAPAGRTPP
jgi:uncharacterized membrane protein